MGYRPSELVELAGPHFADSSSGLAWEAAEYAWREDGVGATEVVTTICGAPGIDPGTVEVFDVLSKAESRKPTEEQFHRACAAVRDRALYDALQLVDRIQAVRPDGVSRIIRARRFGCGARLRAR